MDLLEKELKNIRMPSRTDNVYKDECVYSYDTPETDTGLYVSLTSFLGYGSQYVEDYFRKTGHAVFLLIKRIKKEIPVEQTTADGPEKKITRLAIGVEGGFDSDFGKPKYAYEEFYKIVVFPTRTQFSYPDDNLPMLVTNIVKSILDSESVIAKFEKEALTGTWDGEKRRVSKYAKNLIQLNNDKKIPPSGWKCEQCDLTINLWLNLTDGSILCGRRFFDGSGGNYHAVQHYHECHYPLVVKLGTITADGKGDVYSYIEGEMVEDPYLVEHLAHFGIKTTQMEKTEKSMIELELDLNQRIGEWSILTESASKLIPIAGPGFTGMKNLGNSCYLNSVMQVIFVIPDFVERFVNKADNYFLTFPQNPADDFNIQMCKLGVGLLSGKYSSIAENTLDSEARGISPAMFKSFIGKNHPDFSTKLQQDAQEFFLHLIDVLERNSRNELNPADALKFSIEDRLECSVSKQVKYTRRNEWCLPLPIPLHLATNIDEVHAYEARLTEAESKGQKLKSEDLVRPRLTLQSCLDAFTQVEHVEQFYSSAINDKTVALKTTRLATMPDYLLLHLKKFTLHSNWTSIKLDVAIEIPDILNLNDYRATGLLPNEVLLPEITVGKEPLPPVIDEDVLTQLYEMGFPPEASKRAIFFTKNTGLETATQWIMEHITDIDFNDPFVPPGTDVKPFVPNPQDLETLMNMGFSTAQASKALKETNNNLERAADYIFSHADEIDVMETVTDDNTEISSSSTSESTAPTTSSIARDGDGKYKLIAFISHMGSSSQSGHYVCHILKNDLWTIFNDSKVAISQKPPKELGYLYLYKRI